MTVAIFDPKKALQLTRIIYFLLLSGITLFLVLVVTFISEPIFRPAFSDPFFLILFILTCVALPAGYYVSKKMLIKVDPNSSINIKYQIYQSGLLIRLATCEGVSLFSIVCALITDNLFFLVFLLISVAVFILYFPAPGKIGTDISLTESEIEQFINH